MCLSLMSSDFKFGEPNILVLKELRLKLPKFESTPVVQEKLQVLRNLEEKTSGLTGRNRDQR